jgi:hypothetical protein
MLQGQKCHLRRVSTRCSLFDFVVARLISHGKVGHVTQAYLCNSTNVLLKGGREASSDPLHISDAFTATSVQAQFEILEIAGQLQANDIVLRQSASLDRTRGNIAGSQSQRQEDRRKHAVERWNVDVMQFC